MFFQGNEKYNCATYLRLSRSDGDQQESNSIKNQRALLNDYMGKHPELHKFDEYVDDGYSGTNFERPDFKRMMQDIEKRNVNCIIVKDLSRFGRNYIETGRYLERIFPFMGVRFIAINDHYDSAEENDDKGRILIPFNNLINDTYCRDISLRVRSHLDVEYVELLLNSVDRCIAIRPCDKNNPNAIRWGRLKEGRWCASTLGCRGLAKALFDIMEWDEDLRYRFRGQFLEQGDNKMMLFAFDEPEMIKVEEIVLPPKESTEEDEGETVKKKIYIFPPEWAGTFGQPITSIAQVGILRQEHYAGNWDVFRPASEIEEMNTFTAESLNKLLHEAEKILEGS